MSRIECVRVFNKNEKNIKSKAQAWQSKGFCGV